MGDPPCDRRADWRTLAATGATSSDQAVWRRIPQAQHILFYAQRQIDFASLGVITSQPNRNLQEFRGRTQLVPQLSCAGIGLACFLRREAFHGHQGRTQAAAKLKLLSPAFAV